MLATTQNKQSTQKEVAKINRQQTEEVNFHWRNNNQPRNNKEGT